MKVSDQTPIELTFSSTDQKRPKNLEEAAAQFETVLVRQFVKSMTDGLFRNSLSGEDGPAWMAGYADTQRDMLTDVLSEHLVNSGKVKFSDLLLRQWHQSSSQDVPESNPKTQE